MQNLGEKKQYQIWNKANILFEEFLTEESFLNYPISELFDDLATHLKTKKRYLEKYWKSLENCNWQEELKELEKCAKEPFSKITVLVAANILIFIWMIGNGIFGSVIPNQLGVYMASALGAEADEINMKAGKAGFSQGLEAQNNNILELKANPENDSISEVKCEKDKEDGRCSALCADIEQYIKLTKDMGEEEKRDWEKAVKEMVSKKPKKTFSYGARCAKKNDHPGKSETKGKHRDEDCCPDPDEWPKPGCAYSAAGLHLMLSGPR